MQLGASACQLFLGREEGAQCTYILVWFEENYLLLPHGVLPLKLFDTPPTPAPAGGC